MKRKGLRIEGARGRRRFAGVAFAALACAGALVARPQDDDASERIALAIAAQSEWIELRTQISKERAALAERKLFLNDRIELARSEIESTREQIEAMSASIADTAKEREALEAENETLKAGSASLEARIDGLESRTKELVKRLPDQLVELVRPLTQKFADNPAESKTGLSQRFTYMVTVLNMIDKFNTDIHVESERRELLNGQKAEVTAMYLGISLAYYVNGEGTAAGRGVPGPDGFVWTPLTDAAETIKLAVGVSNQSETAVYTHLPMAVKGKE